LGKFFHKFNFLSCPLLISLLLSFRCPLIAEKFFLYLSKVRAAKINDLITKRITQAGAKKQGDDVRKIRQNETHLIYGLGHNHFSIRIYDSQIDDALSWYAVREFNSWGQPLVIDLSFLKDMTYKQVKSMIYRLV